MCVGVCVVRVTVVCSLCSLYTNQLFVLDTPWGGQPHPTSQTILTQPLKPFYLTSKTILTQPLKPFTPNLLNHVDVYWSAG